MSTGPDINEQLLGQLALMSKQIEEHRTSIWLLEQRQVSLREQLIAAGWKPPTLEVCNPSFRTEGASK